MKPIEEKTGKAFIKIACCDDKVFMNLVPIDDNADEDTKKAFTIAHGLLGRMIDEIENFSENKKIFSRD